MFRADEKFTNLLPDESTMASDESTGATDSLNQVGELDSMSEVTTKDSSSRASAWARVFAIQGEANPFTTSVEERARLRAIQEATKAREREAYRSAGQRYPILQHNAINNN